MKKLSCTAKMYYLAYSPDRKNKDRSVIPKIFKDLGFERIQRSFWAIPNASLPKAIEILEKYTHNYLLFRKRREIYKPTIQENKDLFKLGSLVIIAYSFPKSSVRKRKMVSRLLRRAPYFKITRNVYAFPQLKYSKFMASESKLITPREFSTIITAIGGHTKILPKLVLVHDWMGSSLIAEMKKIRKYECLSIKQGCERLLSLLKEEKVDVASFKKKFTEIKAKYELTKEVISFFRKVMKIDLLKDCNQAYRSLMKCKKELEKLAYYPIHT